MAIFVDLDDDDNETVQDTSDQPTRSDTPAPKQEDTISTPPSPLPHHEPLTHPSSLITSPESTPPATASLTPRRDLTHLAAAYPVIFSIATQLDHNDLSHLAYTCKQMRENMLQYRKNLLAASLVCSTTTTKTIQSVRRRVLCVRDFVVRCGTCEKPTCRVLAVASLWSSQALSDTCNWAIGWLLCCWWDINTELCIQNWRFDRGESKTTRLSLEASV